MTVNIVIPEPTGSDEAYNRRALPQYIAALDAAGAKTIVVPLNGPQDRVAVILAEVQGILLPGSGFDVEPERYGEARIPECREADPARTAVDELLLQDGFSLRKPILAICQGMQSLNVWRSGSLIQDLKTAVNHRPGREVVEAHEVKIVPGSRLSGLLAPGASLEIQVNSSHHQAVCVPGDKLRVSARCPQDGVVEAVELDADNHFVLGVQWHPERSYAQIAFSRVLFAAFVKAASEWSAPRIGDSVLGR